MSYILTALRRAEAERSGGNGAIEEAPLTAALGESTANSNKVQRRYLWVSLLFLAVVIPVMIFALLPDGNEALVSGEPHTGQRLVKRPISEQSPLAVDGEAESVKKRVAETPVPASGTKSENPRPVMSESVPRELPPLNITGYIFFENNPDNSKLFVDGIVYRHHSRLANGLTIESFHRDYIELRYFGEPHVLSVH